MNDPFEPPFAYRGGVGIEASRTERDEVAARRSARDQWVKSTLDHFLDACQHWRTAPEHSLIKLRHVVEGWAHATSVELDPSFAPYKGGELHRGALADRFGFAAKHLPRDLQTWAKHAKTLGDQVHHNQGDHQRVAPQMAQGSLIQCAALVEWTYREIAGADAPPAFREALRRLRGATLEGSSRPTVVMPFQGPSSSPLPAPPPAPPPFASAATPLPVRTLDGTSAGAVSSSRALAPTRTDDSSRPATLKVAALIGVASILVASVAFWHGASADDSARAPVEPPPLVLAYVDAYGKALASRDVEQIMRLQVFPTRRFFAGVNFSESQVRKLYEGWFATPGHGKTTGFRNCVAMPPSSNGELAAQCDTYVEPPLNPDPGFVPACLVFSSDGRLVSRTEIHKFPTCPPPP